MGSSIFYFLGFVSIFTALMVILSKSPINSVLYLVITFFSIAAQFVLLNAGFLAAVLVIVYAGAIMVLFLFVVMLLNLNKEYEPHKHIYIKFAGGIAGGILLVTLIGALHGSGEIADSTLNGEASYAASTGTIQNLGKSLFSDYLLPFEISSVLFLAAMVGAVFLGKKEKSSPKVSAEKI